MWNPKTELVKHSVRLAEEKHPEGFNKKQLIDASKEVFGGFAMDKLKKVKTLEDVSHKLNEMALIDGNYPLSMSGCEVVGINGGCGATCPVFHEGDCGEPQEFEREDVLRELTDELGEDEAVNVINLYSCFDLVEVEEIFSGTLDQINNLSILKSGK